MNATGSWPQAAPILTGRLDLEPLRTDHAREMAPLLADPELYRFTGGSGLDAVALEQEYGRLAAGQSSTGDEGWLNWVLRRREDGQLVGTVQATLTRSPADTAIVAWVVSTSAQGRGYATEAAAAMVGWLRDAGVQRIEAHIHPDHGASASVASHLGLRPTDGRVDGEVVWLAVRPLSTDEHGRGGHG